MPPPDPDALPNFDRIDRDIRLNEALFQAEEMAREKVREDGLTGAAAEKAVKDWSELYAYDTAPDTSEHEILRAEGLDLPPAEELDDAALNAKLWEVIHALAARNTFLHSTNHLSDRELYTHLIEESFHEITKDIPADSGWVHGIDMIGSGSEEDIDLYLRFYADDEERERWAKDWPKHPIPDKVTPPYDRDRHLPQARFE